jgi:hypothetical protein
MEVIENFSMSEAGAVTVDWVVLTAAAGFIGFAVMSVVSGGVEDLSGDINNQLLVDHVTTRFD